MKNKEFLKLFGLFLIGFTLIISCSSDDDSGSPDNSENPSIFDKWWYDSNDFAADIYFHSDGMYEQNKIVQGVEYVGTGDWMLENEDLGILKVENLEGNGQNFSTIFLKISDIQNKTITVQQSDDGIEYSDELYYQDSNN